MIGTVKEMILPPLVETEATALFITGVVARGSAMGMVVTSLSHVDGCKSGVKRAEISPLHTILSKTKREKVGFIPRGWNLFFSGTGTADFHPEVLEKARPISPSR